MRKTGFCICKNKDADRLHSNYAANQRLCFRQTDSTTPHLPNSEISRLEPSSVAVQPGLCGTWSGTPTTDFLTTRLKYYRLSISASVCDIDVSTEELIQLAIFMLVIKLLNGLKRRLTCQQEKRISEFY